MQVRWWTTALVFWGLSMLTALPAPAATLKHGSTPAASPPQHGSNCVAYARAVTGIELDGNAAAWWPHANGRYERGQVPKLGAILVFKPSGSMRVGHVAVVSRIVGPREILVDQANWIPGRVVNAMSVIDASVGNDWTSVKVIELHSGKHGRENPTFGFIYPRALPTGLIEANTDSSGPRHVYEHVAAAHEKVRREKSELAETGDKTGHASPQLSDEHDKARHSRGQVAENSDKLRHSSARLAELREKDRHEPTALSETKAHPAAPDDAKPKRKPPTLLRPGEQLPNTQ